MAKDTPLAPNYTRNGTDKPIASPMNGKQTKGSLGVLAKHSGPKSGGLDRGQDSPQVLSDACRHLKGQMEEKRGNSGDAAKSIHGRGINRNED